MPNNMYDPIYAEAPAPLVAPMAPMAPMTTPMAPLATPMTDYDCPIEIINHWPEQSTTQRRKASHNAVERRRRDTISEKIKELSILVPPDFDPASAPRASAAERQQKSVVLQRSVDYIRYLQESQYLLQRELDQLQGYAIKREP